jgi:hypothetical protein
VRKEERSPRRKFPRYSISAARLVRRKRRKTLR